MGGQAGNQGGSYPRVSYETGSSYDKGRMDKNQIESLLDVLNRIGIREVAQPPEALGPRYQPVDYKLPQYPPARVPEDVARAF